VGLRRAPASRLAIFLGSPIPVRAWLQVRVNARREALGLGNPLQKRDQLRALCGVEGGENLGLVLIGDPLKVRQQVASSGRQVERVRSPVGGIASPLGEATMLELVDQRDHGAAVEPQRDAERLLGAALGGGEVAERPEVPGMQIERGEALRKAPMGVGAELRQQKADAPAELSAPA
jgi:hypothetical protein